MALVVKNLPTSAGYTRDVGSIPGSGRCPGGGNGIPLQYSCWKISWAEEPDGLRCVHGDAKSQTQLSDWAHTQWFMKLFQPYMCVHQATMINVLLSTSCHQKVWSHWQRLGSLLFLSRNHGTGGFGEGVWGSDLAVGRVLMKAQVDQLPTCLCTHASKCCFLAVASAGKES